jgi:hypothetical protein
MENLGKIQRTLVQEKFKVDYLLGTNKSRKAMIRNIGTISKLVRNIQ